MKNQFFSVFCPFGSETEPTTAPIPCRPGTYNPRERMSDPLNCILCDGGFACPNTGTEKPITSCKTVIITTTF